jgi:hypothetical protein
MTMFVAHYKSVSSPEEFFSEKRETLDFPTQVEMNKKKYSLDTTYQVDSDSMYSQLVDMAQKNNIAYGVKVS